MLGLRNIIVLLGIYQVYSRAVMEVCDKNIPDSTQCAQDVQSCEGSKILLCQRYCKVCTIGAEEQFLSIKQAMRMGTQRATSTAPESCRDKNILCRFRASDCSFDDQVKSDCPQTCDLCYVSNTEKPTSKSSTTKLPTTELITKPTIKERTTPKQTVAPIDTSTQSPSTTTTPEPTNLPDVKSDVKVNVLSDGTWSIGLEMNGILKYKDLRQVLSAVEKTLGKSKGNGIDINRLISVGHKNSAKVQELIIPSG